MLTLHAATSSLATVAPFASHDYFAGGVFMLKSLFCAGLALALAFTALPAIADGSTIHGTVTDPLGAVIHGARVDLLREGKRVAATTTDSEGRYRFSPLPAGRYQVKTHAPS